MKLTKAFIEDIRDLIRAAHATVARGVDLVQVHTNFEIGRRIVEQEQRGKDRAAYGEEVISALAERLTAEFGRGFSTSSLAYMRSFFLLYQDRAKILQSVIGKSGVEKNLQSAIGKSALAQRRSFTLSWTHYIFLLGIKNHDERSFYEIEAGQQDWTVRELKRQFDTSLCERLALSRDKKGIRRLARKGQIISQIERFLLEMGKGFLFEARQKRFTFDDDHFFVDLVFYNRLLRCYVLVDLKLGKLTHQDLGQMQMYVNYFDRHVRIKGETKTVGIVLCAKKNQALVTITLPQGANIHAREYQLYLPSKEVLQKKLVEWAGEAGDA